MVKANLGGIVVGSVLEVFLYFLKLGITGFGGPVALVAIMQKELVEEKKWVDAEKFALVLPLLKAMPGAFSFQTAVYLGNQKAGKLAGFLAGLALILPASLLMVLLGVILNHSGQNPEVKLWITGFQWGAIVLMAAAVENLSKSFWQDKKFWALVAGSLLTLIVFDLSEILLVFLFGMMSLLLERRMSISSKKINSFGLLGTGSLVVAGALPSLGGLFSICFTSGAFVFGTGIAIAPILEKSFVSQLNWITHDEFMTALALSQMTPGPVMVIVTLIGYKTLGILGATVATLSVYSPGWIHMLTWFPKVSDKMVKNKDIQIFLKGALAAVVTSIGFTLFSLSKAGAFNKIGIPLAIALFFINRHYKIKSWMIILLAGITLRALVLI